MDQDIFEKYVKTVFPFGKVRDTMMTVVGDRCLIWFNLLNMKLMNRIKSFSVKILTVAFTLGVLSIAPGMACSIVCNGIIYSCPNCIDNGDGSIQCNGDIIACAPV